MKKKNLKSLNLNKKSIALITQVGIQGGRTSDSSGYLSCIDPNPIEPPKSFGCVPSENTLCVEICKKIYFED
ncbi:hypothetical protein GTQ40_03575 [Flavobacteriaceae bacterium R38]|nr:hypothetical protein [Flavobacteriaceae bacterium R38]